MHNRFRTKHPDADQPRAFVEAYTQPGISVKRQIQVLQRRGRANGVEHRKDTGRID